MPRYKGDPRFNPLREIIRHAQNDTKQLTWSDDPVVAHGAERQWDRLERLFQLLGPFPDIKAPDAN